MKKSLPMAQENAVAYCRVSTDDQSISLESQAERIKAYCQLRGLDLVDSFTDEDVSGKIPLDERPEGKALCTSLGKGQAKHVIAVKLDRLFRSTVNCLQTIEDWDEAGISVHILDMGGSTIDSSSAVGKVFLTLVAAFAEMERGLCSERTTAALTHLREQGRVFNHTPYGFDREGNTLVPNAVEQGVMRRIHFERNGGATLQQIADRLNREGVPTKTGKIWHCSTVKNVLKNKQFEISPEEDAA